jgi:hypothetical protein
VGGKEANYLVVGGKYYSRISDVSRYRLLSSGSWWLGGALHKCDHAYL